MKELSTTYYTVLRYALLLTFWSVLYDCTVIAQVSDSGFRRVDTVVRHIKRIPRVPKDTLGGIVRYVDSISKSSWTTKLHETLSAHPYYAYNGVPVAMVMEERVVQSDAFLFYWMLALFFLYAILKVAFPKYHNDLFNLFFRATLRQQQLREQLLQASVPSLLFNALFFISGGFFLCFWGVYVGWFSQDHLWPYLFYGFAGLFFLYFGKFLVIKFMGWVLRLEKGADSYIFIIFLLNKVLGVFLLPCLLFMAFGLQGASVDWVIKLSLGMIVGMYFYRFLIAYQLVRTEIKLNLFHFFLYLCAFEVAPMLLLSKLLLKQL